MFSIIGWLAFIIHLLFALLCIAAGLYYIAETIEEYTTYSKKIMQKMTLGVLAILTITLFTEKLPWTMFIICFIANLSYYNLLEVFPYIEFGQPSFLISLGLFVLKHYVTLNYFADNYVAYDEVIGFFTVCCWTVPFTILISTSANDQVLPMSGSQHQGDTLSHYMTHKKKRSSFLSVLEGLKDKFMPDKQNKHLY